MATYLDEQDKDASGFLELPDVTRYAASKVLNVAANEIVVQIEDRNYRKLAP